jgi:hypothetical protein
MRHASSFLLLAALVGGCDIDQSRFVPDVIEGVPDAPDFGVVELVTYDVETVDVDQLLADIRANTIYAEIGPTGTSLQGGATLSFTGTGGDVCVLLDPELLSWVQSVSPSNPLEDFVYPDNLFDDGDLDLRVGQSVFYTGTTGQIIGDFVIRFEDSLGVETLQNQNACIYPGSSPDFPIYFGGRGALETCAVESTIPGTSYTVVMETFSLPIDDARLAFGVALIEGDCLQLDQVLASRMSDFYLRECIIRGEAVKPGSVQGALATQAGLAGPTWLGEDEVPSWEGSREFEQSFCNLGEAEAADRDKLAAFCKREVEAVEESGDTCSWATEAQGTSGQDRRCFCGDRSQTPTGGGL